jgi:hypothetical protein
MSNWRPEGWENPHHCDYIPDYLNAEFQDVENGANLMLELLKKQKNAVIVNSNCHSVGEIAEEYFKIIQPNMKGTLVFIPDDEVNK